MATSALERWKSSQADTCEIRYRIEKSQADVRQILSSPAPREKIQSQDKAGRGNS